MKKYKFVKKQRTQALRKYLIRSSAQKTIKTFSEITKTIESSFFPHCAGE